MSRLETVQTNPGPPASRRPVVILIRIATRTHPDTATDCR